MKGRRSGMGAELVPLALILGCVAGSLALVIAVHRQKNSRKPPDSPLAIVVAPSPPPPKPAPAPPKAPEAEVAEVEEPDLPAPADPTPGVLAKLTSAEAEQLLEASRADRKSASLEEARKAALAESERWRRREALVHAQLDSLDGKVRKMEGEIDALALERDALERERDARKALAARARSRPSTAILPHRGPNGTWRRPIVIECTNGMAILQPRGVEFGLLDLAMGFGPSTSPFVATVAREAIRIQGQGTPDGQPVIPYIFFVVRPDGIRPYYEARGRLESLGITFGYELADQDWDIDFPDLDDTSTWDGSAPRGGRLAGGESDEDALDKVLHPRAARGQVPGPAPSSTVSAEDQEFPTFSNPASASASGGRRAGPVAPGDANGFAWPSTPTPRYITESGIGGTDPSRGLGPGQPSKPGGDTADPAGRPAPSALPGGSSGGSGRRPLDRQGRASIARADGAANPDPSSVPGKDPVDLILAGGPPGGLMPILPESPGDARPAGKPPGAGSGTPTSPPSPARSGFGPAPAGAKVGSGLARSATTRTDPGSTQRGRIGPDSAEVPPTAGDDGLNLAQADQTGSGPTPPSDLDPGGGSPPARSPLDGGAQGGPPGGNPGLDRPASLAGASGDGRASDRSEPDPGRSFVWPKGAAGSNPPGAPPRLDPSQLDTADLNPGAETPPPGSPSPISEDLGQVGSPSSSPSADPNSAGGRGTQGGARGGQPKGRTGMSPSGANPDRSGDPGAGGSDPARRMLAQGSPSASASGSPAQAPPQGLAALGLGLPNGMSPPQGEPGEDPPAPPSASPRSRPSAMPNLPSPKIHDATFEVVVVCGPKGVTVQPGGYRVTAKALKEQDGLFRKQIVGLVKGKRMSEPDLAVDPEVRFLVQSGGAETYRTARSQFLLSGLDWPATTQVADPDPLGILPSEGW